ncbi:hypothetical protein ACTFIY_008554 [Dictyostelium cf. discoideum]
MEENNIVQPQCNNECFEHPPEKIQSVCIECEEPVCIICITSDKHRSHTFKLLKEEYVSPMISKLKKTIPIFKNSSKSIDKVSKKSEMEFEEKKSQLEKISNTVKTEFDGIQRHVTMVLNNFLREISTECQKDDDIYKHIDQKLKTIKSSTSHIIDLYDNENEIHPSNYVAVLKHYEQSKKLLSSLDDPLPNYRKITFSIEPDQIQSVKNILYENIFKIIGESQDEFIIPKNPSEILDEPINDKNNTTDINNNNNIINNNNKTDENDISIEKEEGGISFNSQFQRQLVQEKIYEHLLKPKMQLNIKSQQQQEEEKKLSYIIPHNKVLKKTTFDGVEFTIYENGGVVPETENIAIGVGQNLPPIFPSSCLRLLLPDGFNQSLESLPPSIENLYIFNIDYQLVRGSIPNSVSYIYFCDGFSQKLIYGIVPENAIAISLHDILISPSDDFVSGETLVYVTESFKQFHSLKRNSETKFELGKYQY